MTNDERNKLLDQLYAAEGRTRPGTVGAVLAHKAEQTKPRYWMGGAPSACDLCSEPITTEFTDCGVPSARGRWGSICPTCFTLEGCRVGPGHGQRYEKQTDGRWLKTAG
jgi:hypothetical protein